MSNLYNEWALEHSKENTHTRLLHGKFRLQNLCRENKASIHKFFLEKKVRDETNLSLMCTQNFNNWVFDKTYYYAATVKWVAIDCLILSLIFNLSLL